MVGNLFRIEIPAPSWFQSVEVLAPRKQTTDASKRGGVDASCGDVDNCLEYNQLAHTYHMYIYKYCIRINMERDVYVWKVLLLVYMNVYMNAYKTRGELQLSCFLFVFLLG